MKPLFARFVPAMVSEQPTSARENARLWGGLHSIRHYLEGGMDEEEEEEEDKRARIAVPRRTRDQRRGTITRRNSL
jgi:hypothetical protein